MTRPAARRRRSWVPAALACVVAAALAGCTGCTAIADDMMDPSDPGFDPEHYVPDDDET